MTQESKKLLMIIGNSNVGKSSITRLLLPKKQYKGKTGKTPGSTLLIKKISSPELPFQIVDLPGFGYMRKTSKRREEHIKQKMVKHIEKNHRDYFLGLVVLNILRIEDELDKYFIEKTHTIPLSFELITFLREFEIPVLVIVNKIDKVSIFDIKRILDFLIKAARQYGLTLIPIEDFQNDYSIEIPYLKFSALNGENLGKLKEEIYKIL
ncbi:MAG: 50S ribosome-binding GTPase [Candidatus Lokiarchaeota archaeon]